MTFEPLAPPARRCYIIPMTGTVELKVDLPPDLTADEGRLFMALKGFELGRLTVGQAAKLAGFSKRAFMDVLARHHIPVMNYAPDELEREVNA